MVDAVSIPSIKVGDCLGHYGLLEKIGSGGMGAVYRAWDTILERHVAIKVLLPESMAKPEHRQRFILEAKAASALNHPNIITIYEIGQSDARDFIVMEYVEGHTLEHLISTGPLPLGRAIAIAIQIADAMGKAHAAEIIHRDLKPSNIMINRDGHVKILDFGLVKQGSSHDFIGEEQIFNPAPMLTQDGRLMGTLAYMAPEQAEGKQADARCDIFALGLILYEMLTGKRPFANDLNFALITSVTDKNFVPLHRALPEILPKAGQIVMRCLSLEPHKRWQSMGELKEALEAFKGQPDKAIWTPAVTSLKGKALFAALFIFLSVSILLGFQFNRWKNIANRHASQTESQMTFSGYAHSPALSPDGKQVAYVLREPGKKQSVMVRNDQNLERELYSADFIEALRWSANSRELLFFWENYNGPVRGNFGICLLSPDKGMMGQMPGGIGCWIKRDGSRLATAFTSYKKINILNQKGDRLSDFYLSKYTWLLDMDCHFSSGTLMAAVETDGKYQIRLFNPDGSNERVVLEHSEQIYSARWSTTGKFIYFLARAEDRNSIELLKIALSQSTPQPVLLKNLPTKPDSMTKQFFSLSGSKLVYPKHQICTNLYRVMLPQQPYKDDLSITSLTTGTYDYGAISLAPDGQTVAFSRIENGTPYVCQMPITGGEPYKLAQESLQVESCAWSPDEKYLAFIHQRNGLTRFDAISLVDEQIQPLAGVQIAAAAWGINGIVGWHQDVLTCSREDNKNFVQVNLKTGQIKNVIPNEDGWVPCKPIFSPDGKKMAVFRNSKDWGYGLWLLSLEPYSEKNLASGYVLPAGWTPDQRSVYAVRGKNFIECSEVIQIKADSPGEVLSLGKVPNTVLDACVTPDGRHMVMNMIEKITTDIWMIQGFDPAE